MPFTAQYAAAQLGKLDNSPLFHGHTFPLSRELSAYLGYAPDFAPPSFAEWARTHGRIPTDDCDVYDGYMMIRMHPSDFDNDNFDVDAVDANVLRPRGGPDGYLAIERVLARPWRVRELRWGHTLFNIALEVATNYMDMNFCARWGRAHRSNWPNTSSGVHPAISGAVRIYQQHAERVRAHSSYQYEIMRMRNRRLEV